MRLSIKQKIIGLIAIIGTILILIFQGGFYSKSNSKIEKPVENASLPIQTDKPQIISTSPNPLDQTILWGTEPIEITFDSPLENAPELKYRLEPKSEMKVELSSDKKTAKFIPVKPLPLGVGFTFTILAESKFEGKKTLGKEYTYHFRTIEYKGV